MQQSQINETIEATLARLGLATHIDTDRFQSIVKLF